MVALLISVSHSATLELQENISKFILLLKKSPTHGVISKIGLPALTIIWSKYILCMYKVFKELMRISCSKITQPGRITHPCSLVTWEARGKRIARICDIWITLRKSKKLFKKKKKPVILDNQMVSYWNSWKSAVTFFFQIILFPCLSSYSAGSWNISGGTLFQSA